MLNHCDPIKDVVSEMILLIIMSFSVLDLRLAVRSSLGVKQTATHEHQYGEETYDEDEDMYSKTCETCDHTLSYEKM